MQNSITIMCFAGVRIVFYDYLQCYVPHVLLFAYGKHTVFTLPVTDTRIIKFRVHKLHLRLFVSLDW